MYLEMFKPRMAAPHMKNPGAAGELGCAYGAGIAEMFQAPLTILRA
jgi:hypothetical protein